jgi:uncharacterized protein
MNPGVLNILFIAFITIIASFIGTLSGFGTSTLLIPTLSLLGVPFSQALLLVGIIHWVGNLWKIIFFREGILWRLIATFALPGILGAFLGARLMVSVPQSVLLRYLGLFLIVYVLILLFMPAFRVKPTDKNAILGGTLSGLSFGFFGMGGVIRSAFLIAYELPKKVYLATTGIIGICVDSTRLATYMHKGVSLQALLLYGLLVFIPASFLGAYSAKNIIEKLPQKYFKLIVALFLLIVGLKLVFAP